MTNRAGLAAPCGIHCGLCLLNKALTDEKLRDTLSQRMNVPPEKATCKGCRAVVGHCPVIGEQCATYICSQEKGMEFCCDCPDFPCSKLLPCSDRAERLPHNIKIYSLCLRKQKGEKVWSEEIGEAYSLYFSGQMKIGRGPFPKE
jgi:Protein of unknown function (DUF3795)